jgi:hypothetical protein
VPERISQTFDRVRPADPQSAQVQKDVQLAQRELAVDPEQAQRRRPQLDAGHEVRVLEARREWRLVRPWWASRPAARQPRPQPLVDAERLGHQRSSAFHPRRGFFIQLVERVDDDLPALVHHVAVDPRNAGGVPSCAVRVVFQPSRRRRERTVRACMHGGLTIAGEKGWGAVMV